MRLCRCVVPVRGSPQTMIGAAICSSRISGCRPMRSSISSRFFSSPRMKDVLLHDAGAVEAALLAHGVAQHLESLDEVVGAEVVQAGLGAVRWP